jgi:uncharacterized membrane protein
MRSKLTVLAIILLLIIGPLTAAVPSSPDPERDDKVRDLPVYMYLQAGTFDPTADHAPGPHWLHQSSTHPYYVIQFDGPIQKAWRDAVTDLGIDLLDYLPDFGYFARVPRSAMDGLKDLDHLRYVGPANPAYRIDPTLWYDSREARDLELVSWRDDLVPKLADTVRQLGGEVIMADYGQVTARMPTHLAMGLVADIGYAIAWLEPYYWPMPHLDNDARIANARQQSDGAYQSDGTAMWSYNSATDTFEGYTGKNVTVAVADSGLDTSHPGFDGRIAAYYDYGSNGEADTHGHGTHCAGIVLGDGDWRTGDVGIDSKYTGIAPEAQLVVQEAFVWGFSASGSSRDASRSGATISSNSWGAGSYGAYTNVARVYDVATRDADSTKMDHQPLLFTFSAGNEGSGSNTVTPPATAKNIITMGATGNNKGGSSANGIVGFSSRGPTDDGRIKPDLVMPGQSVVSARSTNGYACWGWPRPADGQRSYVYASGTSMSCPGAAGAAAVLTQYLRDEKNLDPSPAMIKANLINGATIMSNYDYPGFEQGWGRVNLVGSLIETETYRIYRDDQTMDLDNAPGSSQMTNWFMVHDNTPFKVSLVWTDPGGTTSASKHLINDLDLVLTDPDGVTYYGNEFENSKSKPAGNESVPDRVNNVEGIYLESPKQGIWTIYVRAYNVPQGTQDFALVISGNIEKGHIDLVPSSFESRPQGLEEFGVGMLTARISNLGNRASGAFDYKLEQIHPDGTKVELAKADLAELLPDRFTDLSWSFTGTRGTHKLRLTLDPEDRITESNSSNNVVTVEYFFRGYDVGLSVDISNLRANPGQLVEYTLTVANEGNVADDFRVTLTEPPPGWTAQLIADIFTLETGASSPVLVSVIPPSNATAGEKAKFQFTATSIGNATKTKTVTIVTVVNQIFELGLTAPFDHIELLPGEKGEFPLVLQNPGNGPDEYELIIPRDLEAGWWISVPNEFITVSYRSQEDVSVFLHAPDPAPAGLSVQFNLTARSTKSDMSRSLSLSGTVLQFYNSQYTVVHRDTEADVGARISLPITIDNNGNGPTTYRFDIKAPGPEWNPTLERALLEIDGYRWDQTTLNLTVPTDAINQTYDFTLAIIESGGEVYNFNFTVAVRQFFDLEVAVVSGTPVVTQGDIANLRVRITNNGNGVENVKLLARSPPEYWSFLGPSTFEDIEPFSDQVVTLSFETHKETAGDTYSIDLLTRYGPGYSETVSTGGSVTILTRPDLVIRPGDLNVSIPNPVVGTLIQAHVTVRNLGETEAQEVYVQFYLDGTPLGQVHYVSSVGPGEAESFTIPWLTNVSGIHEISAVVDVTKDVDETNENNNMANLELNIDSIDYETSPGPSSLFALGALTIVALGVARRTRSRLRRS